MNKYVYIAIIALMILCSFSEAAASWQQRFPFVHEEVPFLHKYESLRVEEKPWNFINVLKDVRYLRKMSKMMTHSSQEVEAYFQSRNDLGPAALDLSAHYEFEEGAKTWRLGSVGDIMYLCEGAEQFLRPPLFKRLKEQDVLFGNLETPVVPSQKPSMLHKFNLRFNAPKELLDTLATGGVACAYDESRGPLFDVLSVVNNHSFDRGLEGLKRTMNEVSARGMVNVGIAQDFAGKEPAGRYVIVQRNGLNVGYVAYTWGINNGILDGPTPDYVNEIPFGQRDKLPDLSQLASLLRKCRTEGADIVVASLHWGYEYEYYPVPHFMKIARLIAASGADLIIGHGTHVVQPIEVLHVNLPEYEGTSHYVEDAEDPSPRTCLVAYSLGNFTTVMTSDPCRVGAFLSVEVGRGKLLSGGSRCLLTSAKMSLTYAQHKSKFLNSSHMTMRDVKWALSSQNSNEELREKVKVALAKVCPERLGEKWLKGNEPWKFKASSSSAEMAVNRYECPAAYSIAASGEFTLHAKDEYRLRIDNYESLSAEVLPLPVVQYLKRNSSSLPIATSDSKLKSTDGKRAKVVLTITPKEDATFEFHVADWLLEK